MDQPIIEWEMRAGRLLMLRVAGHTCGSIWCPVKGMHKGKFIVTRGYKSYNSLDEAKKQLIDLIRASYEEVINGIDTWAGRK